MDKADIPFLSASDLSRLIETKEDLSRGGYRVLFGAH